MDDNPPHDERAAQVLALVVQEYRDRGLSDAELTGAGLPGVEKALRLWDPAHGYAFDTWCAWWVRQAIASELEAETPSKPRHPALMDGDFDAEMATKAAVVATDTRTHWKTHKRGLRRLLEDAPRTEDEISPRQMALFSMLAARFDSTIAPWLKKALQVEASAANEFLGDDEQRDYSRFHLHALALPADGDREWSLTVAFKKLDATAEFAFDGWELVDVFWVD